MSAPQHVEKLKAHAMQQHQQMPPPPQEQQQQQDPGHQVQPRPLQGAVEKSSSRCYFFDLPLELREQIYSELLLPTAITITFPDRIAPTQAFAHVPYDAKQLHPAVLRTCPQIWREAILFLYRPSVLHLGTVSTKHPRAKPYKVRGLGFIRHLEALHINISETSAHLGLNQWQSELMWRNLRILLKSIKQVYLGMPNYDDEKDMKATLSLAYSWFICTIETETTTVHLRSPPSGRASRRIGKDGVWRDCTTVFNEDGDSDFGHNGKPNSLLSLLNAGIIDL